MSDHDGAANLRRRNLLKVAAGAAVALVATAGACGQDGPSKSAAQKNHHQVVPPDRGLWITWYDLPTANARARRITVDDQDRLLITEYRGNQVAFFDTRTEKVTELLLGFLKEAK